MSCRMTSFLVRPVSYLYLPHRCIPCCTCPLPHFATATVSGSAPHVSRWSVAVAARPSHDCPHLARGALITVPNTVLIPPDEEPEKLTYLCAYHAKSSYQFHTNDMGLVRCMLGYG
jgi:hypothetical protein